jgi:hypothetical protein
LGRIIFISSESAVNIPVEMIHYGNQTMQVDYPGFGRDDCWHGRDGQFGAS